MLQTQIFSVEKTNRLSQMQKESEIDLNPLFFIYTLKIIEIRLNKIKA